MGPRLLLNVAFMFAITIPTRAERRTEPEPDKIWFIREGAVLSWVDCAGSTGIKNFPYAQALGRS